MQRAVALSRADQLANMEAELATEEEAFVKKNEKIKKTKEKIEKLRREAENLNEELIVAAMNLAVRRIHVEGLRQDLNKHGHSAGVPHGQVPPGSSWMSPSSAMPNTAMTSSSGIVAGSHHPTSGFQPQTQQQLYAQYEPNQPQVLNLGDNYLSSGGMRNSGGPPPSANPPMQGLPSTGSYYGSNSNQGGVYPGGNSQGWDLQQLHMAVAPGPQSLPGGPNPHYGIPYQQQPPMSMQGYNRQDPGSEQGNPMIRPGHSNRK